MSFDWNAEDPYDGFDFEDDQMDSTDPFAEDDGPYFGTKAEELTPEPPEESKYVANRGFLGDTISSLGRGALSLAGLSSHAYETVTGNESGLDEWAKAKRENTDFFKPDADEYWDKRGAVGKGWIGAMESLVVSTGGMIPGALAGAGTGTLIGGPIGTIAGGIVGGLISLGGLFGAGTYGEEKEFALSQGKSEEDAHSYALKRAVIESGGEVLSTGVTMAVGATGLGALAGGVLKIASKPVVGTLKGMYKHGFTKIAKSYAITMGTEVSTEMLQAGAGNEVAKDYGLSTVDTMTAVGESILPAVFMSGIFATVGAGIGARQRSHLKAGLQAKDPKAVAFVTKALEKRDPQLAKDWVQYSNDIIEMGSSFDVNAEIVNLFSEAHAKEIDEYRKADAETILTWDAEKIDASNAWKIREATKRAKGQAKGKKLSEKFIANREQEALTKTWDAVDTEARDLEDTKRQEIEDINKELEITESTKARRTLINTRATKEQEITDGQVAATNAQERSAQYAEDFGLNELEQRDLRITLLQEETKQELTDSPGKKIYEEIQGSLTTEEGTKATLADKLQKATPEVKEPKKAKVPKQPKKPVKAPLKAPKDTTGTSAQEVTELEIQEATALVEEARATMIENPSEGAMNTFEATVSARDQLTAQKKAQEGETYVTPTVRAEVTPESTVAEGVVAEPTKAEVAKRSLKPTQMVGTSLERTSETGSIRTAVGTAASPEQILESREAQENLMKAEEAYKADPTEGTRVRLEEAQAEAEATTEGVIEAEETKEVPKKAKETLSPELNRVLDSSEDIKAYVVGESIARNEDMAQDKSNRKVAEDTKDTTVITYGSHPKTGQQVPMEYTDPDSGSVYIYRKDNSTGNKPKGWYGVDGKPMATGRAEVYDEVIDGVRKEATEAGYAADLEEIAGAKSKLRADATYAEKTQEQVLDDLAVGKEVTSKKDLAKLDNLIGPKAMKAAADAMIRARSESNQKYTTEGIADDMQLEYDSLAEADLSAAQEEKYNDLQLTIEAPVEGVTESVDVVAALDQVISESTGTANEIFASLATFIKGISSEEVLRNITLVTGQEASYYDATTNTVYLKEGASARSIVHETLHAITVYAIKVLPENHMARTQLNEISQGLEDYVISEGILTKQEIADYRLIDGNSAKQKYATSLGAKGRFLYALGSHEELVSMGLTAAPVQEALKKITVPNKNQTSFIKNLWDKLIATVADALGIPTTHFSGLQSLVETTAILADIDKMVDQKNLKYGYKIGPIGDMVTQKKDFLDRNNLPELRKDKKGTLWAKPKGGKLKKISLIRWNQIKESQRKAKLREREAYILGRTKTQATFDWAKDWLTNTSKSASEHLEPVYSVVRRYAPKIAFSMIKMDGKIAAKEAEYAREIQPFLDKLKSLDTNEQDVVGNALNNIDFNRRSADEILKKYGLTEEYKDVEKVLAEIWTRMDNVGLNVFKHKLSYFPRRVKDSAGLMAYLNGHPEDASLFAEILNDKNLTEAQKQDEIANALSSGKMPHGSLRIPGSVKERTIQEVGGKMQEFYYNPMEAIQGHIHEANEAIETRAFIGKHNFKSLANKIYKVSKKIERETDKKKKKALVGEYHELAERYEGYKEISQESVAAYLTDNSKGLTDEAKNAIVVAVRSRLNQKGMHGAIAKVRDAGLITALGSPLNTVTQLGDFVWQVFKNGPMNVIQSMIGEKRVGAKDFALDGPLREFQTGGLSKYVDMTLRVTGFKWLDQFAKGTSMESSLKKAESMTSEKFAEEYGELLGTPEYAKKVHSDLLAGDITEDVKLFVFADVSQFQPISLSQMPARYLTAGNGRIFYTLKSYSIKTLANLRNASIDKFAAGDIKGGTKGLVALTSLLVFANAGIDELKDFLLQREGDYISDHVVDNLLKIGFMSRYTIDKGFREGPVETFIKDVVTPPGLSLLDPLLRDLHHLVSPDTEATYKMLSQVPVIGKFLYNYSPEGSEKRQASEKRKIYKGIRDLAKKGERISTDLRKRVNAYNKEAETPKEKISNKQIRKVQSKAKKPKVAAVVTPQGQGGLFDTITGALSPREAYAAGTPLGAQMSDSLVQATMKSPMVKLLGQNGVEGYKENFYIPGESTKTSKSGVTVGNGVDFGGQDEQKLRDLGIPETLLDKLKPLDLYGKKGLKAKEALDNLSQGEQLTSGEVALLSNVVATSGQAARSEWS